MKRLFPLILSVLAVYLGYGCAHPRKPPVTATAPVKAPASSPSSTPQTNPGDVEPFYEAPSEKEIPASEEAVLAEPAPEEEQVIGGEVEEEIARSVKEEVPKFDIPIVVNAHVEKWMNYFQGRGRKYYAAWLSRSEKYIPMMKRILRENGLPEDLIYLAMIESGFKPYAYSRAKASGPWQFIKGTGRMYGLRVDFWIDERRDAEKSTLAAAQHLKDLYDQFNSWYLAAAGYNAGAGKIEKAIKKYSTEDFWEMTTKNKRYLRAETKDYVPKLIAAALIAKSPDKFGFGAVEYEDPLEYDKVTVPDPIELSKVGTVLGVELDALYDLNPELLRGITPPNMPEYELKLPKGYRERFMASYEKIRKSSAVVVKRHDVRRGQTLASIARQYGKSVEELRTFNNLKGGRVKPGQQLAVPLYEKGVRPKSHEKEPEPATVVAAFVEEQGGEKGKRASTYRVRDGDTLWSISRRFNVSVAKIRALNNLSGGSIKPNQKLKIEARTDPSYIGPSVSAPPEPAPPATSTASVSANEPWKSYSVQDGDSLWTIAKQFNVKVSDITQWNNLKDDRLKIGQVLRVRSGT